MRADEAMPVGTIVQLDPDATTNPAFSGCLLVVTESKSWGVMGYVQSLGENREPGGAAYYRATWDTIEPTGGMAPWVLK